MKTTGWQQHSVRGFLAGAVRKRLELDLQSELVDGRRLYRIIDSGMQTASADGVDRRQALVGAISHVLQPLRKMPQDQPATEAMPLYQQRLGLSLAYQIRRDDRPTC